MPVSHLRHMRSSSLTIISYVLSVLCWIFSLLWRTLFRATMVQFLPWNRFLLLMCVAVKAVIVPSLKWHAWWYQPVREGFQPKLHHCIRKTVRFTPLWYCNCDSKGVVLVALGIDSGFYCWWHCDCSCCCFIRLAVILSLCSASCILVCWLLFSTGGPFSPFENSWHLKSEYRNPQKKQELAEQ